MSDLDDLLSDDPIEEIEEPVDEVEETEEAAEAEPEEPTPEPEPAKEEPVMVPLAAVHAERDKNKDLSRRLEAIEAQASPQPQPVKMPDVFQDPEGFARSMQQQMEQVQLNTSLNASEIAARQVHGDEAVDAALASAKNAGIQQQFLNHRHPWGEMVKWHEQQSFLQEVGNDPEAYKQRLRDEIRQEFEAEQVAKDVVAAAPARAPSLASQPNLGTRAAPAWSGPTSLDDILSG